MKKIVLLLVLVSTLSTANFFKEKDKQMHMAVSVVTGSIGMFIAKKCLDVTNVEAFLYGVGIALLVGLVKELYDEYTYGGFSGADMIANGIGGIVGSGIIFTIYQFNSGAW